MLIIEGILLISALFLFAKNEKERQKIAEIYENKIEEKEKTEEVEKKPKIWEIEIPTLNVNGNIHEGINNKIISDSIGHMKTNQKEEAVILKSLTNDTNKYFEKLEEIKFPKSLEIIDAKGYLFDECPNLKKIILPKGFDLDLVYDDTVSIEYYD